MKSAYRYICIMMALAMVFSMVPLSGTVYAEDDTTAPKCVSYGTASDGITLTIFMNFDEAGTINYVLVPTTGNYPTTQQIKSGQDAAGNAAYLYGSTPNEANVDANINIPYANLSPNSYALCCICEDASGNISDIVYILPSLHASLIITGKMTFSVTDSDSNPVSGASVDWGGTVYTTGEDGKAVITTSTSGSFVYFIYKDGFDGIKGSCIIDQSTEALDVTMTPGTGGYHYFDLNVQDTSGNKQGATVTVDSETVTTDASGKARFILLDGSHTCSINWLGRIPVSDITFESGSDNWTESVTMQIDTDKVTVEIENHVKNSLQTEVSAFMTGNGLTADMVDSLKVSDGSIGSADSVYLTGLQDYLKSIDYSGSASDEGVLSQYAFLNCTALESVAFPAGVTEIGVSSFYNCSSLDTLLLPSTVTLINNGAFYGCSELDSITLPDGLKTINYQAFDGCTALTELILPAGLETINEQAFAGCSSLFDFYTSVAVPTVSATWYSFTGKASGAAIHVPSGAEAAYRAYDDGNTADKIWCGLTIEDPLNPNPVLTYDNVRRTSDTTAIIDVLVDEPALLYYAVVESGAGIPDIVTSTGGTEYNRDSGLEVTGLSEGAKDVYIVAKDLRDNMSGMIMAAVPAYVAPVAYDVVIENHVTGQLGNEIVDFLVNNNATEINEKSIGSLTVKGGMMERETMGGDCFMLYYLSYTRMFDFSGTAFQDNIIFNEQFKDHSMLEEVYLPESITGIGMNAFDGCTNFSKLHLSAVTPPSVFDNAFYGVAGDASVYVPAGCRTVYQAVYGDDGNVEDNLWYGLNIEEETSPATTGSISGTITDSTAAFMPGVDVTVSAGGNVYGTGTTDENGAYSISDIPEGDGYTVTAEKDGYKTAEQTGVEVDAGVATTVDLTMELKVGTISGTVTDGTAPLLGAAISISKDGVLKYTAVTDAEGGYSASGIPEGSGYIVTAEKGGYHTASTNDIQVNTDSITDVDLVMELITGSIGGTVCDKDGNGISGVNINISLGNTGYGTAVTDADGNYTVDEIPPGVGYTATAKNLSYYDKTVTGIEVVGDTTTDTDFVLTARVGTLTGRVSYNGRSISGVTVTISSGERLLGSAVTNWLGNYNIKNIIIGSGYTVNAVKNGYTCAPVTGVQIKEKLSTSINLSMKLVKSSANDITSFWAIGQISSSVIDKANHTVVFTVPRWINVTRLVPYIEVSPKAAIYPASGKRMNFTNPVSYTVTAEDGTQQVWMVTCIKK